MKQSPQSCETARPPLIELLKNNAFIVELIAELTEDEPSKICATLAREHQSMGTAVREELQAWQVTPYVWSDRMAEYYGKANGFLYETLVWNRTGMKHEMRQWIARFLDADGLGPQRILVFGDGLGIDSLFLAESGHAVDYYEVSQRCIRFAKRLSEALGRQLSIVTTPDEVVEGSYDAVVCLDVLEHVPDPPEVVSRLASYLRPGGRLIVHAPFWYIHPAVSTHLKSNVKFSGDWKRLYGVHGLRPIAANWFWDPLVLEKTAPNAAVARVPTSARIKLAMGGTLLKSARLSHLTHVAAVRAMLRQERRRLTELAASLAKPPSSG